MLKKFSKLIPLVLIILLFSCISANAEKYRFTTSTSFPIPYSDSIEVVNYNHNIYTTTSLEDIQYLIDAGIVTSCNPVGISELFEYTLNDVYYEEQTNLSQVYAQFAWNKGVFGDKVKIAIIDSGLSNTASDFNFKNITKVKDYTSTASSTVTYCHDEIGHGSMVTGIIAAKHNNTWGIAGIAPNVEIYVYKCFYLNSSGKQVADNDNIENAVLDAIDTYDVDIINFSAGTKDPDDFKYISDYCEEKGVLLVCAVGNDGKNSGDTIYYPASYDNVIGVGSVNASGHTASHSQRNDYVDMMAPGENIYSVRISGYEKGSGTSFATPHVVAAAALAKSLNPDLTAQELTEALYLTCDAMPSDRYSGRGLLNIQSLLTYVQATLNPNTLVYSQSDSSMYAYCLPSDGYAAYFARYQDNILIDIKESGINAKTSDFVNYIYYIWKKDSLSPYEGDIYALPY